MRSGSEWLNSNWNELLKECFQYPIFNFHSVAWEPDYKFTPISPKYYKYFDSFGVLFVIYFFAPNIFNNSTFLVSYLIHFENEIRPIFP